MMIRQGTATILLTTPRAAANNASPPRRTRIQAAEGKAPGSREVHASLGSLMHSLLTLSANSLKMNAGRQGGFVHQGGNGKYVI